MDATTGCYLSIDFEDFAHDLQRALGVESPTTRPQALRQSVERILEIVRAAPGSDMLTFFSTGQIARDHGAILGELAQAGHEIGCHGYYHDHVWQQDQEAFGRALDRAVALIAEASGQPVHGFRAPFFSIRPQDTWAYEELAKRFRYDSSRVVAERDSKENTTDLMRFGEHELIEFPVYRRQLLPRFSARVIGGTYLKLLPLKVVFRLMDQAITDGFLPVVYIHPYELLYEGEFWVRPEDLHDVPWSRRMHWQMRQHQWLGVGNRGLIRKLAAILRRYPHRGTMVSHLA
jgi:hypothetical protein